MSKTIQLPQKLQKQASYITQQWLDMEKQWSNIDQIIAEKAKKINSVIKLDQLSSVAGVIHDGETEETG